MRTVTGLLLFAAALAGTIQAADADNADLSLRYAANDVQRFDWTISSNSESRGRERGRPFTVTSDSKFNITLVLRNLPFKREGGGAFTGLGTRLPGGRIGLRIQDMSYSDKRAVEDARTELLVSKGRVKYSENGRVIVDSENDIGLDKLVEYREHLRVLENGEMRVTLDAAGKQSDVQGDPALVDALKGGGAEGIFPILSGKATKVGESWDYDFSMAQLGEFKLAKPAVVRSKMTFAKWTTKDGKDLAQIDIVSSWDKQELKGENSQSLLVEISQVDCRGVGTCLFDPALGRFVQGEINMAMKYRIDGEREGQTTGLDVSGKTRFTFVHKAE